VERGAEKETAGDGRKFTKAAWSLSVIASLRVRVRRLHFQSADALIRRALVLGAADNSDNSEAGRQAPRDLNVRQGECASAETSARTSASPTLEARVTQ